MTTQTKKIIQLAVTFLTPYISVASGAIASWLLVRLHILGIIHLTNDQLAKAIASLVIFGITSGLTYLGAHTKLIPLLEKWVESDILGGTPISGALKLSSPITNALDSLSHPVIVNVHIHNPDGTSTEKIGHVVNTTITPAADAPVGGTPS